MSSSLSKALSLLSWFTTAEPEHGLSELARRTLADKATLLRRLSALVDAGLLEQCATTRHYRLGAELLRLAQIREASFPVESVLSPVLANLSDLVGETAHASIFSGGRLGTVGIHPSRKSNRVSLDPGQSLDLHATASGITVLAWSPEPVVQATLQGCLLVRTSRTLTDPERLRVQISEARERGFAEVDQTFEDDVHGIATPVFDAACKAIGAVAVATPSSRMNAELRALIVAALSQASMDVTRGMGGEAPASFVALAKRTAQAQSTAARELSARTSNPVIGSRKCTNPVNNKTSSLR